MKSIESHNRKLSKLLKITQANLQSQFDFSFEIPTDPQKFYEDFGLLTHPKTNQPVTKLTPYQYQIWNAGSRYKYRLIVKSQKVGITTSSLMEDFQKAITTCRGKEILVIAQSLQHAKEHLYTLRKMIMASKKYRVFLINKPTELLFRDEVTKVTVLYIKNPDDPYKPTRIIGLGPKEGAVWSWKEVAHIHMSDVAATSQVDDSGLFGAAFSRLANTNGTMLIETPPKGQRGYVWQIYQQSKVKTSDEEQEEAKFWVKEIEADRAVQAGLITQEFLDRERIRLGTKYGQYYECDFLNAFNTFYDESLINFADYQLEG